MIGRRRDARSSARSSVWNPRPHPTSPRPCLAGETFTIDSRLRVPSDAVRVVDSRAMSSYDPWPEPRVLARGLGFPEGPVYLGDGAVAFTEIRGQCVKRYADGATSVVAKTGGGANGSTLGADGEIWVANNGGISLGPGGYWFAPDPIDGRIQKITADGG